MSNLLFAAQRALLSQPLGMTLNIVKSKLGLRVAGGSQAAAVPLPIDRQYGIQTGGVIKASALRTGTAWDVHNVGYGASVPSIVRRGIEACPDLDTASFVDLGCGKGLPLAVASEYPFRRILGVELSPDLAATAGRNAAHMGATFPERTRIEVVEGDMTTAELPSGYLVAFLYNPGYAPLIRRVAQRLADHQTAGNKVMVVYYNPAGAASFDQQPQFVRHFAAHLPLADDERAASELGNTADSIVVWQGRGDPLYPAHPGADAPVKRVLGGAAGEVQPV